MDFNIRSRYGIWCIASIFVFLRSMFDPSMCDLGKKCITFNCSRIFVEYTRSVIIVTLLVPINICISWNEVLLKLSLIRMFVPSLDIEHYYYNLLWKEQFSFDPGFCFVESRYGHIGSTVVSNDIIGRHFFKSHNFYYKFQLWMSQQQ